MTSAPPADIYPVGLSPRRAGPSLGNGPAPMPLICLCYAHSGIARLKPVLSGKLGIACTQGTGLLPLCEQAAATWTEIDNRDGRLSALAQASIRSMITAMSTAVLASDSGTRWCEIAIAHPAAARTYLKIFPTAKFFCLHRHCLDVVRSAARTYPWGLTDTPFGPFTATFSGTVAPVAAYWRKHTEAMLELEQDHPAAYLRIKHEDVTGDPSAVADQISRFLGSARPANPGSRDVIDDSPGQTNDSTAITAEADDPIQHVPVSQIPAQLRTEIDPLLAQLGYQGLEDDSTALA
jgi:protein-tyrosine sulfotransferase